MQIEAFPKQLKAERLQSAADTSPSLFQTCKKKRLPVRRLLFMRATDTQQER